MRAQRNNIPIPDATFIKDVEKQIEFNLITIHELYSWEIDHSIEKPHRLSFNAIIIMFKGKGIHTVDFVPYSYTKGTVFFITKDQIHNFKINPDSDGYILYFTDNFLTRLIMNDDLNILHDIFDYIYYPAKIQLDNDVFDDVLKLIQVSTAELNSAIIS